MGGGRRRRELSQVSSTKHSLETELIRARVGQDTKPRGLPWTAHSLPCGFWQQASDLPASLTTRQCEHKAGNSTAHGQLLAASCLLGCNMWEELNCSGKERKKAEKKGLF